MLRRRRLVLCALAALLAGGAPTRRADASSYAVVKGAVAPHRIITKRFLLEVSVPPEMGRKYADLCEKAYKKFCRIFHVEPAETVWKGKCIVYLFANRDQFVRFAALAHRSERGMRSGGYTRVRAAYPEIALFLHRNDHIRLQQTLVHEMTHVFVSLFRKPGSVPTWLHEGCAQFFEFQHYAGRSRLGYSRKLMKHLVAKNKHRPLAQLMKDKFQPTDQVSYAQSWSLLDFLINAAKGSSRRTSQFLLLVKQGQPPESALKAAFGWDMARLEALWKTHVLKTY